MSRLAVVIPVKAFSRAKMRLAPALDPAGRRQLARRLATGVIGAVAAHDPWVVCDDEEVRALAESLGAGVIWVPGTDLNGAVTAATDRLAAAGVEVVVVVHADLPYTAHLPAVLDHAAAHPDSVVIVPDEEGLGTNVLSVPARRGFRFSYGPGSCPAHQAEAERLGLAVLLRPDDELSMDLDRPADLARLQRGGSPAHQPSPTTESP